MPIYYFATNKKKGLKFQDSPIIGKLFSQPEKPRKFSYIMIS